MVGKAGVNFDGDTEVSFGNGAAFDRDRPSRALVEGSGASRYGVPETRRR